MPEQSHRASSLQKVAITTAVASFVGTCVYTCIALSQAVGEAPPPAAPTTAAAPVTVQPATVPSKTVEIAFVTVPPTEATVFWGKTRLGRITSISPLVIVRPRDSGPLDVVVRADGFLPVQTRAHTFADTRISVKLTRPDETTTLLGYRVPIDAGVPDAAAGAPPFDPNASPLWNATPTWSMIPQQQNMTPVAPVVPAPPPAAPAPAPAPAPNP